MLGRPIKPEPATGARNRVKAGFHAGSGSAAVCAETLETVIDRLAHTAHLNGGDHFPA
jgi:hypothetical protein